MACETAITDGRAMRRVVCRILDVCQTIEEEGFVDGQATWYAADRLQAIIEVAQAALNGDPLACADGICPPVGKTLESAACYYDDRGNFYGG